MSYTLLTQDERDLSLIRTMKAQEQDHFSHTTNIERFNTMLQTLEEGDYKNYITKLRNDSIAELAKVNAIIAALELQMPSPERVQELLNQV